MLSDLDPYSSFPKPDHELDLFHHAGTSSLQEWLQAVEIVPSPLRPPERLEIVLGPLLAGRPRVELEPEHAAAHKRVLQFGVGVLGGVPFHEVQNMKGVFRLHDVHAGAQA